MRILVVSNLFPPAVSGGYELECAGVVAHLRAQGHEVRVLASTAARRAVGEEAGVRRALPLLAGRTRDSLRAPLAALQAARIMRAELAGGRPDLVYVWNGSGIPHAALRIAAASGPPIAFRICEHWFGSLYDADTFLRHLTPGERGLRGAWARLMRLVNRHPLLRIELDRPIPTALCWNSEALRRMTPVPRSLLPVLERTVFPVTAQAEQLAGVRRAPSKDPPLVAFVGRIEPQKGPQVAYRALAALRQRHGITARLELAGASDPATLRELERLAAELGITAQVRLLGPLALEPLAALLARAWAIVIPPVWEEPAGLVGLEAAFAGVPIVAARSGGIPELLRHEREALLFDKGDADACADALAAILSRPALATALAQRARRRAAEHSLAAYLVAMDRFLLEAAGALGVSGATATTTPAAAAPTIGAARVGKGAR